MQRYCSMMMCCKLVLFGCLLVTSLASTAAIGNSGGRQLLSTCPDTCQKCVTIGTGSRAVMSCHKCYSNLVVVKTSDLAANGTCGCAPGTYSHGIGKSASCADCPVGSWCPGGGFASAKPALCPANMTTIGTRSHQSSACVNLPGYYFTSTGAGGNGAGAATLCPPNSYCPGLLKQRKCSPCFPGGVTRDNHTVRADIKACVAPPGYHVSYKSGTQVTSAAPGDAPLRAQRCRRGEFAAGFNLETMCRSCPAGVTTDDSAAPKTSRADCNTIRAGLHGVYNARSGIQQLDRCPVGFYCPGGTLSAATPEAKVSCNTTGVSGLWTHPGARAPSQCLVPPGFFFDSSSQSVLRCANGSFRGDWSDYMNATACEPCGPGIRTEGTSFLSIKLNWGDPEYPLVAANYGSCFIPAGWGMYQLFDGTYAARPCNGSIEYGYPRKLFGWSDTPCNLCSPGKMTITSDSRADPDLFVSADDGSTLAISAAACVTLPGYGFDGTTAQRCSQGTYNEGGNRSPCTRCEEGLTTLASGATSGSMCVNSTDSSVSRRRLLAAQSEPFLTFDDQRQKDSSNESSLKHQRTIVLSPGQPWPTGQVMTELPEVVVVPFES